MTMLPPRNEVRSRLLRLIEGLDTRESADEWAAEHIAHDDEDTQVGGPAWDEGVWTALLHLFGSDMKISDDEYLHGPNNFRAWLDEFDRNDPNKP